MEYLADGIKWIAGVGLMIITALLGIVWKDHKDKIKELDEKKVDKEVYEINQGYIISEIKGIKSDGTTSLNMLRNMQLHMARKDPDFKPVSE